MFQMLSGGDTRYIGVKTVGDILNATTMCPVRTLKLHFRAHFKCFQHVIPGHIVNTWCLESQCSHQVLRPLPPVTTSWWKHFKSRPSFGKFRQVTTSHSQSVGHSRPS